MIGQFVDREAALEVALPSQRADTTVSVATVMDRQSV
jgi:hypothetical protein